jgi:hypothetical protein
MILKMEIFCRILKGRRCNLRLAIFFNAACGRIFISQHPSHALTLSRSHVLMITNSVRLFIRRPSSVSFVATGCVSPKPLNDKRDASMPRSIKY